MGMPPESLRDDVRFLAGAVERQQRFYRAALTPPIAVTWAVYIAVLGWVNSIGLWNYTAHWAMYVDQLGFIAAVAVTIWVPWRKSVKRGEIVEHTWRDFAHIF